MRTCYADGTLVLAQQRTYREVAVLATAGVAEVIGRIRRLGFEVALNKAEALYFHAPRPKGATIWSPHYHRWRQNRRHEEHEIPRTCFRLSVEFPVPLYIFGPETVEDGGGIGAPFAQYRWAERLEPSAVHRSGQVDGPLRCSRVGGHPGSAQRHPAAMCAEGDGRSGQYRGIEPSSVRRRACWLESCHGTWMCFLWRRSIAGVGA